MDAELCGGLILVATSGALHRCYLPRDLRQGLPGGSPSGRRASGPLWPTCSAERALLWTDRRVAVIRRSGAFPAPPSGTLFTSTPVECHHSGRSYALRDGSRIRASCRIRYHPPHGLRPPTPTASCCSAPTRRGRCCANAARSSSPGL